MDFMQASPGILDSSPTLAQASFCYHTYTLEYKQNRAEILMHWKQNVINLLSN